MANVGTKSQSPNVNGRPSCIVLGVTLGPDLNFPSSSFSEVILPKVNELNLSLSIRWFTTTDTEDRESPSTGAVRRMPRDSFNKRCENYSLKELNQNYDRNIVFYVIVFSDVPALCFTSF